MDPAVLIPRIMHALKGHDDISVAATFYTFDPGNVESLVVPENACVAKYIPHDAFLPHISDVHPPVNFH